MLKQLFLAVLTASLATSAMILPMLLSASATGKRFSARWRYWVWLVLAVRLVLPLDFALPQAPATLTMPAKQIVVTHAPETAPTPQQTSPDSDAGSLPQEDTAAAQPMGCGSTRPVQEAVPSAPQGAAADTSPRQYSASLIYLLEILWAGGAVLSLLWQSVSYLRFRQRLAPWNEKVTDGRTRELLGKLCTEQGCGAKVMLCRNRLIKSPMMTGFFRPVILLPAVPVSDGDLAIVLRHELTHYRRHDLWYKLLLVLARSIHWFNPLVWLMLREADRDLEITCDEAVVKGTPPEFRQSYCEAILRLMRSGMNRQALLSTSFSGGKKVLKRRFTTVLNCKIRRGGAILAVMLLATLCTAVLVSCTYEGDMPAPSEAGQQEPAVQLPVVTGPDENGQFPSISDDDFERWVTRGEPDTVKPDDSAVTPFLETKACTDWLRQWYPAITDWQVLYEYDSYTLRRGEYDPYRYQWRDQYLPNRVTVLSTSQSTEFDRIALVSIEEYAVITSEVHTPRCETLIYYCTGWEDTLQMGDLSGAQAVFTEGDEWYPSLWQAERQRAFLLDFNMQVILPVANAAEEPPVIFNSFETSDFALGEERSGDLFVCASDGVFKEEFDWYYYNARMQTLSLFTGCTGANPQYFPLDDTTLALQSEGEVCLYDLASEPPTTPIAVIGGNGQGLGEGGVWIMYQIANDRSYPDHHTFLYYTEAQREWRVCTFTGTGEILSDFSTGLPVVEDYIGSTTYADGLVYFVYYSGGSGNSASRRQYCVDARPGYDHTLQRFE